MTIKQSTDLITHFAHTQSESDVDYCLRTRVARVSVRPSGTAGTADKFALVRPEKACVVTACHLIPTTALTADDSNYATLNLTKEDTVGGGFTATTAIATAMTTKSTGGTGNWVAGEVESFAGIDDTDTLSASQTLILEIAKTGTGVAVSNGGLLVEVHYRLL